MAHKKMVAGVTLAFLVMTGVAMAQTPTPAPSLPPCGNYVGQEYLVSVSGRCILPDGEIMAGGIWAPRHPGQSVTYVVNWTTGGDNSQGKNQGYAAIHGCTGDIVKFNLNPNEQHNLVLVNNANSVCDFTNGQILLPTNNMGDPPRSYNLTNPLNSFRVISDSVNAGTNCMAGKMHIQVVMHRPTTPKYGCYAPGSVVPGYPNYPDAPSPPPMLGAGAPQTAAPSPSPPSPAPPSPKPPSPQPPSPKPPSPSPPKQTPSPSPSPSPKATVSPSPSPSPTVKAAYPPPPARQPVGSGDDQCQCYC